MRRVQDRNVGGNGWCFEIVPTLLLVMGGAEVAAHALTE